MKMFTRSPRKDSRQMDLLDWMSSAAASHASHLAQPHEAEKLPPISGLKCCGLSENSCLDTSSLKTFRKRQSPTRLETSVDLATARTTAVYLQMMQGLTIKEIVGGSVHTPTTKANFIAPSMQKWPSCQRFVKAFGGRPITPEQFEFLMGFPIGWTDLEH